MKLGLGTVQLGLDYGLSNTRGKVAERDAGEILARALTAGIDLIDTAPAYGEAEKLLGLLLPGGLKIVTKTAHAEAALPARERADAVVAAFRRSLTDLCVPAVYGLLVHRAEDLLLSGGDRLYEALLALRSAALVAKVGVSVYGARQIDEILRRFPVDMVQLPLNAFDQRLLRSGHVAELAGRGVEVHARSVFLQGLLLMEPAAVPPHLDGLRGRLARYRGWLAANGLTPVAGALAFIRQAVGVERVVLGVTSVAELDEAVAVSNAATGVTHDFAQFACDDDALLNPVRWPARAAA